MIALQEYELKLKPTTIVKGHGLCKLATGATDPKDQEEEGWQEEPTLYT
jgi:hypothetical protein